MLAIVRRIYKSFGFKPYFCSNVFHRKFKVLWNVLLLKIIDDVSYGTQKKREEVN